MKNTQRFRTRYAPSPTGFLHIGNARTALFAFLLAKHYKGDFLIRIEDTDLKRNVSQGVNNQLESLKWLGVDYDEGPLKENPKYAPYYQSKRLFLYKKYLETLLKNNFIYPCFCKKEDLEKMKEKQKKQGKKAFMYDRRCLHMKEDKRMDLLKKKVDHVYRFFIPQEKKSISWNDLIRGRITFDTKDVEDFIVMKSNGYPVYNFANVIDDHLMNITHVIRGEEHISNTPKQILLYEALSWHQPKFAHLPIIVNKNNKKLSKRDKNELQFFSQFQKEGILPQAVFNYLSFLGWSPGDEREIYSKDELISLFSFSRISKAPAKYNTTKLFWYNKEYLKNLTPKDKHHLKKKLFQNDNHNSISYENRIINLKHLVSNILEINEWTLKDHNKVVSNTIKRIEDSLVNNSHPSLEDNSLFLKLVLEYIDNLKVLKYDDENKKLVFIMNINYWENKIKEKLKSIMKESKTKPRVFYHTIRSFLTSESSGPELWRIILITCIIKWIKGVKHKKKL